jgi:hypothetical protein
MFDSLARFKIIVYSTMGCVILEAMCQQVRPLKVYWRQFLLMSFRLKARINTALDKFATSTCSVNSDFPTISIMAKS